jgi:uncharacterized repeat protein (TIGR03803 family)
MVQGRDGNLYGTSTDGGASGRGTIFQLTPDGKVTVIHSFSGGADGCLGPINSLLGQFNSALLVGTDGNLYGGAGCGPNGYGVFFKLSTDGTFTAIHAFTADDGGLGVGAAPVEGFDGNFYGIGGSPKGYGSLYRLTPADELTTLYSFDTGTGDSWSHLVYPYRLTLGSDGNLYGTTVGVVNVWKGTVFKMTTAGELTVLHTFSGPDGLAAGGPLAQAGDGNFYGVTGYGGTANFGTVFSVTPTGDFTSLFSFHRDKFGIEPAAALVEASDGKFYGGTRCAPGSPCGIAVLFQINASGNITSQYDFKAGGSEGGASNALVQHTNGTLFGTGYEGGSRDCVSGCGTLYSLNAGLPPFVRFLPAQSAGSPGASIGLFGQGFSGASSVAFNGTSAKFVVASDTFLTAAVPDGATSGPITVSTSGSSLKSNVDFRVAPPATSTPTATSTPLPAPTATGTPAVVPGTDTPPADTTPSDAPAPDVTLPDAASPAMALETGDVPDTLTDKVRQDITEAINRANTAFARAKATGSTSGLDGNVADSELRDDQAEVARETAANRLEKNTQVALNIADITLDSPGHATVHTTESWSVEYDTSDGRLIARAGASTFTETYTVEFQYGGWIVTIDHIDTRS